MSPLQRLFLLVVFALLPLPAVAEPGFQSISILFSETWTGNAYRPPTYPVSGSESTPLDAAAGAGVRLNLVDPFIFDSGALAIDPRITLSSRRFLLFPDGRVVPTPQETRFGATETGEPATGTARVLTTALAVPVGLEINLGSQAALVLAVSPTVILRIRTGEAVFVTDVSELRPMYSFFYGRLRWLRPELHIAARFDVSEFLAFTVRSVTGVSILDLADTTLPWWDQFSTGAAVELNLTPPLSGLFRQEESKRKLTLPESDE